MSNWRVLDLEIASESPLHFGDQSKHSNYVQTHRGIPGASIRGAVAASALAACSEPGYQGNHADCPDRAECPFWRLFGAGPEPRFGFAWPGASGPARPFPLTARTCKNHPGYDSGDGRSHGVFDTMLDQAAFGLISDPQFPFRDQLQPSLAGKWAHLAHLPEDECPVCGGTLIPADGTYVEDAGGIPGYAGRLSIRRATHVGINRERSVAEDGLLFTVETIEPEAGLSLFHAQVVSPPESADLLIEYLRQEAFVGRGRSRGMGRVSLWADQTRSESNLEDRLAVFGDAMRAAVRTYQQTDQRVSLDMPGLMFSLTLASPAIVESFGRYRTTWDPDLMDLPGTFLVQSWVRTEVATGWDSASRLQRRTRLAMQPGSVFLYWLSDGRMRGRLVDTLRRIELEGIGEETSRGYGQVQVCAPFHRHSRLGQEQLERSTT